MPVKNNTKSNQNEEYFCKYGDDYGRDQKTDYPDN